MLTMRFFVQGNETISLRNMADVYASLHVTPDLVEKFNDARAKTNAGLDKPMPMNLGGHVLTWREIYEVFLWGGLTHANAKKKLGYDFWVRNPILFALLENEFVLATGLLWNMIFFT